MLFSIVQLLFDTMPVLLDIAPLLFVIGVASLKKSFEIISFFLRTFPVFLYLSDTSRCCLTSFCCCLISFQCCLISPQGGLILFQRCLILPNVIWNRSIFVYHYPDVFCYGSSAVCYCGIDTVSMLFDMVPTVLFDILANFLQFSVLLSAERH